MSESISHIVHTFKVGVMRTNAVEAVAKLIAAKDGDPAFDRKKVRDITKRQDYRKEARNMLKEAGI
jgi:hypothetical protein